MYDWYDRVQWSQISELLNSGHPSILSQLIVVNAISIAFIVFIRLRLKSTVRNRPKYFFQEMLLLANMIILSESQLSGVYFENILPMVDKFRQYAS